VQLSGRAARAYVNGILRELVQLVAEVAASMVRGDESVPAMVRTAAGALSALRVAIVALMRGGSNAPPAGQFHLQQLDFVSPEAVRGLCQATVQEVIPIMESLCATGATNP